jgi:hypothetical protein
MEASAKMARNALTLLSLMALAARCLGQDTCDPKPSVTLSDAASTLAEYACIPDTKVSEQQAVDDVSAAVTSTVTLVADGCAVDGTDATDASALADVVVRGFQGSSSCDCKRASSVIAFTVSGTLDQATSAYKDGGSDKLDSSVADLAPNVVADIANFVDSNCDPVYGVRDQSAETCVVLSAGNETEPALLSGGLAASFACDVGSNATNGSIPTAPGVAMAFASAIVNIV